MLEAVIAEAVKAETETENFLSRVSVNQQELSSLRAPKSGEGKVCSRRRSVNAQLHLDVIDLHSSF
jgi:hypothetical protein